jgi:hypothetical protein
MGWAMCAIIGRWDHTKVEVVPIMALSSIFIYGCNDVCMNIILRQDNHFYRSQHLCMGSMIMTFIV